MDSSEPTLSPEQAEAHRHLILFLRGLSKLDAALGLWRPDYGRLRASAAAAGSPASEADITEAHRLYADGLGYFADRPGIARTLRMAAASDIAAAIEDSIIRFGTPIAPVEWLVSPAARADLRAPGGQPPGIAISEADILAAGGRVALSPWDAEHSAAAPPAGRGAPVRKAPPPAPRGSEPAVARQPVKPPVQRGPASDRSPGQQPGKRGVLIGLGVAALLVMIVLVAAAVFSAKYLLGAGPTAPGAVASPAQATLPPSDLPSGSPANVLAPVAACTTLPSGKLPTGLTLSSTTSGIGTDPAAGYSNPFITIQLSGPVQSSTPAFSLIAAVLPFDATAPASATASATSGPVDRAGTLQLIAFWSGSQWHGALRNWSGSAWSSILVDAASGVDVVQNGPVVTLYWEGLAAGDKYGVIVASSTGCADLGLSSSLVPEQTYGATPTP
ncbi:MAG: hypothetical protein ABSB36_08960 [Candidatus Dormibacteria bacterium]